MQAEAIKNNRITGAVSGLPPVAWILLLMVVVFRVFSPNYFKLGNISNIFIQSMPLMLVAFAQTIIVLTEGIDLSLGAQVSFVTVLWILLLQKGIPIAIAAVLTVLALIGVGAVNGFVIGKMKVNSFIATLGTQYILYSVSLLLTAGASISFFHPMFEVVSATAVLRVPVSVWITAVMFGLTWIMLYKTTLGATVFALGGNPEAVVLAGINTARVSVMVYGFAGLLTAVSGLITACRLESGQPVVGAGWEFEAVAAALIGGTSFREGKGGIGGTILGVLLISTLENGLDLSGVSSLYQSALIGLVILAAITIDVLVRRRRDS